MTGSALSIGRAWRAVRDRLVAADIPTAALDAQMLVRHVLDLDATGLIVAEGEPFLDDKHSELDTLVARRLAGEPIARILGEQEFYGLIFGLNAATLIPRPETEMLVEFGIDKLAPMAAPRLLDLGTGTGCIALSILVNLPRCTGVGVDIAPQALDQARRNAKRLGVENRFATAQGDWFEPLGPDRFDLIVSNPPYIASAVIDTLAPGVKSYDPMSALDGGEDGLAPYRTIAAQSDAFLAPEGQLALEIGFDQGHFVIALLERHGWRDVTLSQDLAGHDRMVTALKPK